MSNAVLSALDATLTSTLDTLLRLAETTLEFHDDAQTVLEEQIESHLNNLAALDVQCAALDGIFVPAEVVQRVENAENPDVFTANYMERLAAENQFTNGKLQSLKDFKSILARQLDEMYPQASDEYKAQLKAVQ